MLVFAGMQGEIMVQRQDHSAQLTVTEIPRLCHLVTMLILSYLTFFSQVRTLLGKILTLQCESSNILIDTLKERIHTMSGIPYAHLRVMYRSKELANHSTLEEYQIPNDATLHLASHVTPFHLSLIPHHPSHAHLPISHPPNVFAGDDCNYSIWRIQIVWSIPLPVDGGYAMTYKWNVTKRFREFDLIQEILRQQHVDLSTLQHPINTSMKMSSDNMSEDVLEERTQAIKEFLELINTMTWRGEAEESLLQFMHARDNLPFECQPPRYEGTRTPFIENTGVLKTMFVSNKIVIIDPLDEVLFRVYYEEDALEAAGLSDARMMTPDQYTTARLRVLSSPDYVLFREGFEIVYNSSSQVLTRQGEPLQYIYSKLNSDIFEYIHVMEEAQYKKMRGVDEKSIPTPPQGMMEAKDTANGVMYKRYTDDKKPMAGHPAISSSSSSASLPMQCFWSPNYLGVNTPYIAKMLHDGTPCIVPIGDGSYPFPCEVRDYSGTKQVGKEKYKKEMQGVGVDTILQGIQMTNSTPQASPTASPSSSVSSTPASSTRVLQQHKKDASSTSSSYSSSSSSSSSTSPLPLTSSTSTPSLTPLSLTSLHVVSSCNISNTSWYVRLSFLSYRQKSISHQQRLIRKHKRVWDERMAECRKFQEMLCCTKEEMEYINKKRDSYNNPSLLASLLRDYNLRYSISIEQGTNVKSIRPAVDAWFERKDEWWIVDKQRVEGECGEEVATGASEATSPDSLDPPDSPTTPPPPPPHARMSAAASTAVPATSSPSAQPRQLKQKKLGLITIVYQNIDPTTNLPSENIYRTRQFTFCVDWIENVVDPSTEPTIIPEFSLHDVHMPSSTTSAHRPLCFLSYNYPHRYLHQPSSVAVRKSLMVDKKEKQLVIMDHEKQLEHDEKEEEEQEEEGMELLHEWTDIQRQRSGGILAATERMRMTSQPQIFIN